MKGVSYRVLIISSLTALLLAGAGWAQQASVGGLVPISQLGTPTQITKPALTQRGGQLIFSDSPEQLKATTPLPGAMYRDQVEGRFRVFYHHQNVSSATVTVGVAITNNTTQLELLFGRGQGQGLNIYPDVAGQTALSEFLASHRSISFLAILPPGQSYWSVQDVPQGDTASAILEYAVLTIGGAETTTSLPLELFQDLKPHPFAPQGNNAPALPDGFGFGTATVTTLAYAGAQPSDPVTVPILPGDSHTRGTFPHFDRFGTFTVAASGGLQYLAVDTAPPGHPFSNDMPGEYELGVDAVDGGIQVYDNGNYGVLYNFHIALQNNFPPKPLPFALFMQPSGGSGHYVMFVDQNLALSPFVSYKSAWWFDALSLRGILTFVDLQTSLTGGSSGPQKVLFDPGFIGQ